MRLYKSQEKGAGGSLLPGTGWGWEHFAIRWAQPTLHQEQDAKSLHPLNNESLSINKKCINREFTTDSIRKLFHWAIALSYFTMLSFYLISLCLFTSYKQCL